MGQKNVGTWMYIFSGDKSKVLRRRGESWLERKQTTERDRHWEADDEERKRRLKQKNV